MDVNCKGNFPIFQHCDVAYFDNAASTHKPSCVIERMHTFYAHEYAPVHRGIYDLAERATSMYEGVRAQVARFIGAAHADEIVFTRGTTESINLIVCGWGEYEITAEDEIVVSMLEHHAMIVPWQQLALRKGARMVYMPVLPTGELDMVAACACITEKTKVVGITAGSNVVGVATDLAPIITRAKAVGAKILVDGAQMIPRQRYDMQQLGCDWFVFSGHKMLGPTGVGVLYIKKDLHSAMHPVMFGGSMVRSVTSEESTWRSVPSLLEPGTPPIAQVIGLGAALEYLDAVDFTALQKHEAALCAQFLDGMQSLSNISVVGPIDVLREHGHLVSFCVRGMHPYDVAEYLNRCKVAVRAGHHCAQPLHTALSLPSTVRASFYLYSTYEDVERLLRSLRQLL